MLFFTKEMKPAIIFSNARRPLFWATRGPSVTPRGAICNAQGGQV